MNLQGKKILIGFAEAAAAPEVVFSLKSLGADITAWTRAGAGASIEHLPGLSIVPITAPETSIEQALSDAAAVLDTSTYDFIMPLDDAAVWLTGKLRLPARTRLIGPTGANADLALNKSLQVQAAKAAGFAVPETNVITTAADLGGLRLPYILKAAHAASDRYGVKLTRGKAIFVEDEAGVAQAVKAIANIGPALAQPLIRGTGEGVFGLARGGELLAFSGHKRVRMTNPHGSGSSACAFLMPPEETLAPTRRFLRDANWSGLFMIELLRDCPGTPWFMELNGRAWGSMALARRAGFEFPAWAVAAAADPEFLPEIPDAPAGLELRHLGNDLVHLAFVLRGPKTAAHRRDWPRLMPTLKNVLAPGKASAFYNWDAAHPGFFARDALNTLTRFARARLG